MMSMRTIVTVLGVFVSLVTTVTSDQLLVTSLEDNTIPVFEVYNPTRDQVDVVFLLILIYLLFRSGVFQKFLVRGDWA